MKETRICIYKLSNNDDNKGGGDFEVMNSWGTDFGVNGFFWISYADFTKHVNDCYALIGKKNK